MKDQLMARYLGVGVEVDVHVVEESAPVVVGPLEELVPDEEDIGVGGEEEVGCHPSDTVDLQGDGGLVCSVLIPSFTAQLRIGLLDGNDRLLLIGK
jgi:hypothetical protein